MTLQQLRYILTIAETGSLNKAAEVLYVSQPSLTNSLRDLESEVGFEIFHRGGRGVAPTGEGEDFLLYARQVYHQYEAMMEKYGGGESIKKKFCVSTQHYSFAVKAFVQLVQKYDTSKYELAIRETKTLDVISDVTNLKSELGLLYLSDFNRKILQKMLRSGGLEFHPLTTCKAYVYLWKEHPLAGAKSLSLGELEEYPFISFEQGGNGSFYFAEDILSMNEYPRMIKVCDRATVLNLMVGLGGYTICSRIICEELNGGDYVAVPLDTTDLEQSNEMEIGYIVKKDTILSKMANRYIEELTKYLSANAE